MGASASLQGAGIGIAAVQNFLKVKTASAAASFQRGVADLEFREASRAAGENLENQFVEFGRQQGEVNRVANEDKSDLTRAFDAELAAIEVAFAEQGGAAGSSNAAREAFSLEFEEGEALSRTESNRENQIAALQQGKEVARQGFTNVINQASLQRQIAKTEADVRQSSAKVNAFVSTINSGVQIATGARRQRLLRDAARRG